MHLKKKKPQPHDSQGSFVPSWSEHGRRVLDPAWFKVTPWLQDVTDEQRVSSSESLMNLRYKVSHILKLEVMSQIIVFLLMLGIDADDCCR